jgi:hypothetical protein
MVDNDDKLYCRNLVGLIHAKYCSDANYVPDTVALSIFSQIHSLRKL